VTANSGLSRSLPKFNNLFIGPLPTFPENFMQIRFVELGAAELQSIDNRKKNLLSSNMSSTCPHNMVNFGLLAADIGLPVWGTPANFNGFRVLAALLHGI